MTRRLHSSRTEFHIPAGTPEPPDHVVDLRFYDDRFGTAPCLRCRRDIPSPQWIETPCPGEETTP